MLVLKYQRYCVKELEYCIFNRCVTKFSIMRYNYDSITDLIHDPGLIPFCLHGMRRACDWLCGGGSLDELFIAGDLEVEEVEMYLNDIMYEEFHAVIDDGSLGKVRWVL